MTDIPNSIASYGIAAILAFKWGPDIIRGLLNRKNGTGSNGTCKAGDVVTPLMASHNRETLDVLGRIEANTKDTRDGIRDLTATLTRQRR